jgi:hypothetical protein
MDANFCIFAKSNKLDGCVCCAVRRHDALKGGWDPGLGRLAHFSQTEDPYFTPPLLTHEKNEHTTSLMHNMVNF